MAASMDKFFLEGFIAQSEGIDRGANPYSPSGVAWVEWLDGWNNRSRSVTSLSMIASSIRADYAASRAWGASLSRWGLLPE